MKQSFILSLFMIIYFFSHSSPLQAQWVQVSGSYGGYTPCLAVDGTNLLADTANGVFFSSNSGANWTTANSASHRYI